MSEMRTPPARRGAMNKEAREATSKGRETDHRYPMCRRVMNSWSSGPEYSTLTVVIGSFVPYLFEHHPLIGAIAP